jgi:integral membrane protein (TIGR01906 family)
MSEAPKSPLAPRRSKLADKLIAPLTAIFLAAAVVWSIITPNFLEAQYAQLRPDPFGLTNTERLELAKTAVLYIHLWAPPETALNIIAEQTLPAGTPLYAKEELSHLIDVKHLTDTIRIMGLSALALLFTCLITLYPPRLRRFALQRTAVGGLLLIPAALLLLIGIILLWPLFFVKFHELLFADGTWTFNETAGLIRLFPELFWFRVGQTILTRMLMAGAITGITSLAAFLYLNHRSNRQEEKRSPKSHIQPRRLANYQQELRWLKLGLITVIPNALMCYLLGFAWQSFRTVPATSILAAVVALLVGWATSTAYDQRHHKPVEAYEMCEINEYMVSFFGLGTALIGFGLISLGSFPLLSFLAPGIIVSGLFILALGFGQLISEYFARRLILD